MLPNILIALASVTVAAAHGGVTGYTFGGKYYPGFRPYNSASGQTTIARQYATHDPITSATSGNIACNTPGTTTNPQLDGPITAGSTITAHWGNWPHDIGPVLVYLANCGGSCTSANPSSLSWFKIDEAGLISGTQQKGVWGQGQLQKSNNSWTSTVPKNTPNGNYLIRHELLAIHTTRQPQWYSECAQLIVSGGGGGSPGPTIRLPGGYSQSDPSINIDVWSSTATTYAIPGPAVWRG